jgi:hypothetical protein
MNNTQITDLKQKMSVVKFNNKDLIIVSLLEYICNINGKSNQLFSVICDYLQQNGIIDDECVYNEDYSKYRLLYNKFIASILSNKQQSLPSIPNILSNKFDNNVPALTYDTHDIDNKDKYNNDKYNIDKLEDISDSRYITDFIEYDRIGKGGFGSVFRAYNKLDSNLYAIKKITIDKLSDETDNFYLNEIRFLSKLSHPNIVRYYTTWIEFNKVKNNITPTLYIQMELCSSSLEKYIMDRNYNNINIDTGHELNIFKQIVKGIKYIHSQNIVHADLNPNNIFITNDSKNNIKIGDFGLSKKINNNQIHNSSNSYGNELYMAPEFIANKICGFPSDIYSMGIILIELFFPFKTLMEKVITIEKIKEKKYSPQFQFTELFNKMITSDYNKRITISEISHSIKNV